METFGHETAINNFLRFQPQEEIMSFIPNIDAVIGKITRFSTRVDGKRISYLLNFFHVWGV